MEYRATTAQWHAERAALRPKAAKLATNAVLRRYVEDRLAGRITHPDGRPIEEPRTLWRKRRHGPRQARRWARAWSPEQISARLEVDFPEDDTMRISHEAIYSLLYVQGAGRCGASCPPACGRAERSGSPEPASGAEANPSSRPTS
jgi:IS30 family transposase